MNDKILNYFCFPEQGVCVALRNYAILLFNPQKLHCVSSRKIHQMTSQKIFIVSLSTLRQPCICKCQ
jgi:hypothetical protein